MKLPRVRFTVRQLMVLVAIAGLGAWLVRVAMEVAADPNGNVLFCVFRSPVTGEVNAITHCDTRTFWARYVRTLTRRQWPGDYQCPCGDGPNAQTRRGLRLVQTFDRAEDADTLLERLRAERLRAVP
jgi:hypothetical protein